MTHIDSLGVLDESVWLDLALGPVTKYPHLEYTMHDVRKAGARLNGSMIWTDETRDEIIEAFHVAESWRSSHVLPMRSVRMSLAARLRSAKANGITAARAKRFSSVRAKLKRFPTMNLDQINDLAGCRAIVDDIRGVWRLVDECKAKFPHEIHGKEYDYIKEPKDDGYRSYHMVFRFRGTGEAYAFNGHRVEVQLRTRLQHSWATAVEAVGRFRGENMKGGGGDPDWRRLFRLMSLEFATTERCLDDGEQERAIRLSEIKDLNRRLGAAAFLENIKTATQFVKHYVIAENQSPFYLIRHDTKTHQVSVELFQDAVSGARSMSKIELGIEANDDPYDAVLIDVGHIASLIDSYPGYFGDVGLFAQNLRFLCEGKDAVEFTLAPQAILKAPPREDPDMSWFQYASRRRWDERDRRKKKGKRR